MNEITFTRGTNTYTFNVANGGPGGMTMYLTGAVGWGIPPITRITQRGPFQDGDTYIDFRLNPRIINLPIVIPCSSYAAYADARVYVNRLFSPGNDVATLRQYVNEFPYAVDQSIDVKIAGATMDSTPNDFNVRAVIQLRADDPTWYSTTQEVVQLSQLQFGTPTAYPKSYSVPYGSYSINQVVTVAYSGDVAAYPVLQCIGPLTGLVVSDGAGRLISFTDTIPALNTWTVDLRNGRKTITDQDGVNRFSSLSITSDIVNFGLYPDPIFPLGLQIFSVSATATTNDSTVIMYYYERYIGV
jgi:hypothetical protein